MILELDIGNTRVKWRLIDRAGQPVDTGAVAALDQLPGALAGRALERARVACVRPGELVPIVAEILRSGWGIEPEVARVQRVCGGVTVAYRDPQRLGVDRWLTLLAAHRLSAGAAVIVDCGTAMTVDLLTAGGEHLGGYIVPGLRLGPLALTEHTAIRLESEPRWAVDPGTSTEEAIYHGVLLMLSSLLNATLARELPRLAGPQDPVLFLTGGDAPLLRPLLSVDHRFDIRETSGLVFEGLGIALP